MPTFVVETPRERYPVNVSRGALAALAEHIPAKAGKLFVVTTRDVWDLHGERMKAALGSKSFDVLFFPGGEERKRMASVEELAEQMVRAGADRTSLVIAFGGGIVGDLGGFLAAIFMRGISLIQVPTTLLAQVDAGVGGKTGANLVGGKNLIGAFHQPLAVLIDPDVIAFRDQFLVPPDGERFRVVRGDAAEYVAQCEEKADVVIIDAFDRDGVAPALCTREFYRDVRAMLSRSGVVAANLVGPKAERVAHLEMLRTVFEGNVILLPIADDGNYVAFAFRDPAFEPRWRWMAGEARALKARYGLDFPRLAARLERSRKLGFLRREMHAPDVQTRRL